SRPMVCSFCDSSLVFGASIDRFSTTFRRPSRASCEKIEQIPARNIFLLTLCEKFSSGVFGKIRPPPRHRGDDDIPARARPVPFWRHGFLVVWWTSSRSFCLRLPLRA